jgi:hypothetical protein
MKATKVILAILAVLNLMFAIFNAVKGDIGIELVNLFASYVCWKSVRD